MHKETPESVRALVSFFAIFLVFAAVLGAVSDQPLVLPGFVFTLTLAIGYSYIAIFWHKLLATRPARIRTILIGNLILIGGFTAYSLFRGGDNSAILGCLIALGATSFVLSAVSAYSHRDVTSQTDNG